MKKVLGNIEEHEKVKIWEINLNIKYENSEKMKNRKK